jgi:hypothetical protein
VAFATLLGTLLLGVQILPYAEWLREAAPAAERTLETPRLTDLLSLVLPQFFGRDGSALAVRLPDAGLLYTGLVSVLLLALWCALRFSAPEALRRRVEGLLATCLAFTALGCAAAWVNVVRVEPRLFFLANDFVFALVGAAAVEEWVELNAEECKRAIRRFFSILLILCVLIGVAVGFRYSDHRPDAPALWTQAALASGLLGAFLVLLIATALKPSRRVTAYGAGVLIAAELLIAYVPRTSHIPPTLFFPETEFIKVLHESKGRVGGGEALATWPLGMHGIAQMRGPGEAQSQRAAWFAERLRDDPLLLRRSASETLLLTKDDIQGPFATARSSLRVRHVLPAGAVLFEDLDVKPRVWVAYDWLSVPQGAPDLITSGGPPVVETTVAAPQASRDVAPRESLTLHGANDHVVVQANLEQPGLLVLTDSVYPGWKGYIDDKDTPILGVDSLFRGVEVGKGAHTIEFIYEPESVRLGLLVSLAGAGLFLAGLLFHGTRSAIRRLRTRTSQV